jgi:phosphoribosylamine--glycine ligase
VLMIGSGGREHALSWKLVQSARCAQLFFAPGNPGATHAKIARVLPAQLDVDDQAAVRVLHTRLDWVLKCPQGGASPASRGLCGDDALLLSTALLLKTE